MEQSIPFLGKRNRHSVPFQSVKNGSFFEGYLCITCMYRASHIDTIYTCIYIII